MAKKKISISNDAAVLKEMAKELDADVADLEIDERHPFGFNAGVTVKCVELGSQEYYVVQNENDAYELAREYVQMQLRDEPELFNQDFIQGHINMDRLRRDLHSDVYDMAYERIKEDDPEVSDKDAENQAEEQTQQELKNPLDFLEQIYNREDAVKKAIEIAGIDIDAAADEAVRTDGAGHFLSSYDGNLNDTAGGLTYWRHN